MILLDTSGLLSALFPDQRAHLACAEILRETRGPLILSPFVLAEVDYLITRQAGVAAEARFLEEVARGAYRLEEFRPEDIGEACRLIEGYRSLEIGLADASIVVLARRYGVDRLLTLDQRHFRALPGPHGRQFRLLPSDA